MKRFLVFWHWAVAQDDSLLLNLVAAAIPVLAGFAWVFGTVSLLIFGHILLGGLLIIAPIALVLLRGVREFNRCHPDG